MGVESRHVASCIVLAEELHFGRAATRLGMTQPGLSRLIGDLEKRVGTTLFRRTTRLVELTEAGKAFLTECRVALDHLERAVTVAQRTAAGEAGTLRIAYMDFAINGRLPELIRAFHQGRPQVHLELSHLPTQSQREALLANRIDIGFTLRGIDSDTIESYVFDTDYYVALLPITHRFSNVRNLTLAALAEEPFVLGSGGSWAAYQSGFFAISHRCGFHPNVVQEASSSDGIFGLVAAGVGVSTYASCVRNMQRRGIVIRSLDDVPDPIPISAIWLRPPRTAAVAAFVHFLNTVWGTSKPIQRA